MSGSGLAVFGASAPLLNDVVLLGAAAGTPGDATLDAAIVSVVVATVPAAESTHAFMFVSVVWVMLSRAAFVWATAAAFTESVFATGGTNVVNCAEATAGTTASSTSASRLRSISRFLFIATAVRRAYGVPRPASPR